MEPIAEENIEMPEAQTYPESSEMLRCGLMQHTKLMLGFTLQYSKIPGRTNRNKSSEQPFNYDHKDIEKKQ